MAIEVCSRSPGCNKRWVRARRDVGNERCEKLCLHRQALHGLRQAGFQHLRRGQAGLARPLRRGAGQVAAGISKPASSPRSTCVCSTVATCSEDCSTASRARTGYDHQVAHIGSTHVGTQPGVERDVGLRHRAQ